MKLSNTVKFFLVFFCFAIALVMFMLKLPSAFRHIDKELHTTFYFMAAAFLNILFAGKNLLKHAFIFIFLYLLGMSIEHAQEYSNKFYHKVIHGRYDPEDVKANLKGLILFSAVWIVYVMIRFLYEKLFHKKMEQK